MRASSLGRSAAAVTFGLLMSCGDAATDPPVASQLGLVTAPSVTVQNRAELAVQPVVRLLDDQDRPISSAGVAVTVAITSGGGALVGSTTVATTENGIASFNDLAIAGTAGNKVLTFSAAGLDPITAPVTTTPGPPTTIALHAGSGQSATVGGTLAVSPAVRVTDADDNGVPGLAVTFAVRENQSTIAGASPSTDATGVAALGSWRLDWIGTHRMVAITTAPNDSIEFQATGNAPILAQEDGGLSGHLSAAANMAAPPVNFMYGFSAYGTVHAITDEPKRVTQLGWGTWLRPDNRGTGVALCPVGTTARDYWPERGPTWWEVYQSIEGGLGSWGNTQFPSPFPKFRLNVTPDCYSSQVASTGWYWGGTAHLPEKLHIVAQLSNRVLTPPDGITMAPPASNAMLGYGWIALPLIPAMTSLAGEPTGDQSWTLFLNASNFRGPVAFYTPEAFSAVNALNAPARGHGLDSLPGFFDAVAVEIGLTPMFTSTDSGGTRYRRIPKLEFPAAANGEAVIQQDVSYYSRAAIWNSFRTWRDGGAATTTFDPSGTVLATLDWSNFQLHFSGVPVVPNNEFTAGIVQTAAGGPALGYMWKGDLTAGIFPEYFREDGGQWVPVSSGSVPRETWLMDQEFAPLPRGNVPNVDPSPSSPWSSAKWAAGPYTTTLSDGSVVEYVWYRFVDQPAIARLGLTAGARDSLQAFVESFHESTGLFGPSIAPPSTGTLASLDPAVIVTPPVGLSKGYVPIVIGQR